MTEELFHSERPEIIQALHDSLYQYNLDRTGARRRCLVLPEETLKNMRAIVLRDSESGDLLGGLVWHFIPERDVLFVDFLWTDSEYRGKGFGTRLLRSVDEIAKSARCSAMELTTNTFQAPDFYRKHGFRVISQEIEPTHTDPDNVHYTLRRETDRL